MADGDMWADRREGIMYEGNFMKFSQNPVLQKFESN
jgi:predicted NAD-dependent protein-ADP-ribosyltransferase YbiA (DUF1768 family)